MIGEFIKCGTIWYDKMSRGLTLCTLMQHFIAQPFILSKAFQVAGTLKEESNDRYKSCSLPVPL